jgi:hypothetical protein
MSDLQTLPPEAPAAPADSEGQGNRKLLLLLVGVVGVVVLGAAAYFLFLSGGEEEPLPPITKGTPAAEAGAGKSGQDEANTGGNDDGGQVLPGSADDDLKVGTDPFEPLPAEEAAAAEAETAATDDGATAVTDEGNGGKGGDVAATTYEVQVASVDSGSGKANVVVDGKSYVVKVGDVFPSATTGPFKAVAVGKSNAGVPYVKVAYGSDLPVIIKKGGSAEFGG